MPHMSKLDANEIEREHVEEDVRDAGVHEHVGDELPDGELADRVRGRARVTISAGAK